MSAQTDLPQFLTLKEWKSQTALVGNPRSSHLKAVDAALDAYEKASVKDRSAKVKQICSAIEKWSASKVGKSAGSSGYMYLLMSKRNNTGAIETLVGKLRSLEGKPASWPDNRATVPGVISYTPTATDVAVFDTFRRSAITECVTMIAAMDVDWFDTILGMVDTAGSASLNSGITGQLGFGDTHASAISDFGSSFLSLVEDRVNKKLGNPAGQKMLSIAGVSSKLLLTGLVNFLLAEGLGKQAIPFLGSIKSLTAAIKNGSVKLAMANKATNAWNSLDVLVDRNTPFGTAMDVFEDFLTLEIAAESGKLAYSVVKNGLMLALEATSAGGTAVVSMIVSVAEAVVSLFYQLITSLIFRKSITTCREWTKAGVLPMDIDFRAWMGGCPILGAYMIVNAKPEAALAMFSRRGAISGIEFCAASQKLLKVRQVAAVYIRDNPVKVKWSGPYGKDYEKLLFGDDKMKGGLKGGRGLIGNLATTGQASLDIMKIHDFSLSEHASPSEAFRHKLQHDAKRILSWSDKGFGLLIG